MSKQGILQKYHEQKYINHSKNHLLIDLGKVAPNILADNGYTIIEYLEHTTYVIVMIPEWETTEQSIEKILQLGEIKDIQIDAKVNIEPILPNDPLISQQSTNFATAGVDGLLWQYFEDYAFPISNPLVAVLDTGFWHQHEDLVGQMLEGYNTISGTSNVRGNSAHGTYTSGIICAKSNNGIGITGFGFNSKVFPILWGNTNTNLIKSINKAVEMGAKVISMSLYSGSYIDPAINQIADYVHSKGILMFAAAGNTSQQVNWLPMHNHIYGVSGIVGVPPHVSIGSVYNEYTKFCAPFSAYTTNDPENSGVENLYRTLSGTSLSTPYVSALASLVFSVGNFTPDDVINIMSRNCVIESPPEGSEQFGYGVIRFNKTIKDAMTVSGVYTHDGKLIKQLRTSDGTKISELWYADSNGILKKIWNPTSY